MSIAAQRRTIVRIHAQPNGAGPPSICVELVANPIGEVVAEARLNVAEARVVAVNLWSAAQYADELASLWKFLGVRSRLSLKQVQRVQADYKRWRDEEYRKREQEVLADLGLEAGKSETKKTRKKKT